MGLCQATQLSLVRQSITLEFGQLDSKPDSVISQILIFIGASFPSLYDRNNNSIYLIVTAGGLNIMPHETLRTGWDIVRNTYLLLFSEGV